MVRAGNNDSDGNDSLKIYSANNVTPVPLGTMDLFRTDYFTGALTCGLAGSPTLSTLTMSGSSLTVTLGTASGAAGLRTTAAANAKVRWTLAVGPTDVFGNPATTTSTP